VETWESPYLKRTNRKNILLMDKMARKRRIQFVLPAALPYDQRERTFLMELIDIGGIKVIKVGMGYEYNVRAPFTIPRPTGRHIKPSLEGLCIDWIKDKVNTIEEKGHEGIYVPY
jgi:hypothetical protein